MRTILVNISLAFLLLFLISSCKKNEMEYKDAQVSPVEALYAPVENQQVTLRSDEGANLLFQWPASHAQDGQLVSYEVIFYKDANSETPVYRIVSDGGGKQLYATISHLDINRASSAAGIPVGETGTLYWTVVSWRGLNSATCLQKNKLTVKRLEGFEAIPEAVYITGDATETGTDISKALQLKKTEDGKFEIYTKLEKDGSFKFINGRTGDVSSYYINTSAKLAESESDAQVSQVSETRVYRLTIDFTNRGTTSMKITQMGLFFSPENKVVLNLNYQGDGIWSGTGVINFRPESWGKDQRYKFQLETSSGTKQIGALNGTDSPPAASAPASYYYVKLLDQTSQWDDKWKFADAVDGASTTITLIMNAGGPYTHIIKVN